MNEKLSETQTILINVQSDVKWIVQQMKEDKVAIDRVPVHTQQIDEHQRRLDSHSERIDNHAKELAICNTDISHAKGIAAGISAVLGAAMGWVSSYFKH